MAEQPEWVCDYCGVKYGKHGPGLSTWHEGVCGVCGKQRAVTEPRDYGYLDMERVKKEPPK